MTYDRNTLGIEALPPADIFKHIHRANRMNRFAHWICENAGNIFCGIGAAACLGYLLALSQFHW